MTEKATHEGKPIILVPAPEQSLCHGCIGHGSLETCVSLPPCMKPSGTRFFGVWIYEDKDHVRADRLGRWSAITIGVAILIDMGLDAAYLMGWLP